MLNKKLNVIGHKCGYDEVRIYVSVMTTQNTYFKLYTEPTGYSIHILLKLFSGIVFHICMTICGIPTISSSQNRANRV